MRHGTSARFQSSHTASWLMDPITIHARFLQASLQSYVKASIPTAVDCEPGMSRNDVVSPQTEHPEQHWVEAVASPATRMRTKETSAIVNDLPMAASPPLSIALGSSIGGSARNIPFRL